MVPGLIKVIVTPGSTAPDSSTTVPPMAPTPCAAAGCENNNTARIATPQCQGVLVIGTSSRSRAIRTPEGPGGLYARYVRASTRRAVLMSGFHKETMGLEERKKPRCRFPFGH